MGIIQCAENCKYQRDGYCCLEKLAQVNSVSGGCPYFTEKSPDKGNCLGKTSDTYKLYAFGNGGDLL